MIAESWSGHWRHQAIANRRPRYLLPCNHFLLLQDTVIQPLLATVGPCSDPDPNHSTATLERHELATISVAVRVIKNPHLPSPFINAALPAFVITHGPGL